MAGYSLRCYKASIHTKHCTMVYIRVRVARRKCIAAIKIWLKLPWYQTVSRTNSKLNHGQQVLNPISCRESPADIAQHDYVILCTYTLVTCGSRPYNWTTLYPLVDVLRGD